MLFSEIYAIRRKSPICWKGHVESKTFSLRFMLFYLIAATFANCEGLWNSIGYRRPVSSVGWVSDDRVDDCGFEPWPDQHSGSLNNWVESAVYVMGLLQLSNQSRRTEEQMTHWDMLNKATIFEFSLFNMSQCVICSPVWRFCNKWSLS